MRVNYTLFKLTFLHTCNNTILCIILIVWKYIEEKCLLIRIFD